MILVGYRWQMMSKYIAFLFVVLACLSPARLALAAENCDLTINISNVNLIWSLNLPTQQITFNIDKEKNDACNYFVTFSKGGPTNYDRRMLSGSSTLPYQLYKEASLTNILKELPDVTNNDEVITGSFGKGKDQTQSRTYFLQIPFNLATTPQLKPSGSYNNSIIVRVYEGVLGSGTLNHSDNILIRTVIPEIIQLSLVNTGGAFNSGDTTQAVEFGTLAAGASRGFDMRVLTNAGYQVTFSSQNNGVLKHTSANVTTVVPYTLKINGAPKSLTSSKTNPVVVASGGGQTSVDGAGHAVDVTIDSVSDKMAGAYSDIITVTAATTD